MNHQLLKVIKQHSPIDAMALTAKVDSSKPKTPDVVYPTVQRDLNVLVEAGEVAIIGQKYIDKYGKLFNVYSSDLVQLKEQEAGYKMRQKNRQIMSLAMTLYKEYKEHLQVQPLQDALTMVASGVGKFSLEYHLLNRDDIALVYRRVIQDAAEWFKSETAYRQQEPFKRFKIPY